MALVQMYFAVENIAMTADHWTALVDDLGAILARGKESHQILQMQYPEATAPLGGKAVIVEALFDENDINPNTFEQRLSNITGRSLGQITRADSTVSYVEQLTQAPASTLTHIATFRYSSADQVLVRMFGGVSPLPTREQSHAEEQAYLTLNEAAWYDYSGGS